MHADMSLWRIDEPGYEWYSSLDEILNLLVDRGHGQYRVEKWSITERHAPYRFEDAFTVEVCGIDLFTVEVSEAGVTVSFESEKE